MSDVPRPGLPEFHRALVERLVRDVRPVKRLWPVGARMAIWSAFVTVLFLVVVPLSPGFARPDRAQEPLFVLAIAGLLLAAALAALLALRAAVPGEGPAWIESTLVVFIATGAVLAAAEPVGAPHPAGTFLASAAWCACNVVFAAGVPWLMLLVAIRRGAAPSTTLAGLLAGLAAFLVGAAITRAGCAFDDRPHLVAGHLALVPLGALGSALLGRAWLARSR